MTVGNLNVKRIMLVSLVLEIRYLAGITYDKERHTLPFAQVKCEYLHSLYCRVESGLLTGLMQLARYWGSNMVC
jgi:hypothetical protein